MNQRSLSNCNAVHSVAGQDTLVVFADSDIDGLKNAKSRHVTAVVGDSGTGKSSIVKSDISSRAEEINLIWLSQDELDKPNQHVLASSLGIADDWPDASGKFHETGLPRPGRGGTIFSARSGARFRDRQSNAVRPHFGL